ncbi:hypothetical protein [Streptomyces bungoensis]|uniref:hypothetical protein n=1 Tax=Streptomyces bungoensis TaxID=285568 RepID=UPI0034232CE0
MAHDFVELVRSRRLELHLSYQTLAAASVDPVSGAKASTGWLHRLETGAPIIPPSLRLKGHETDYSASCGGWVKREPKPVPGKPKK